MRGKANFTTPSIPQISGGASLTRWRLVPDPLPDYARHATYVPFSRLLPKASALVSLADAVQRRRTSGDLPAHREHVERAYFLMRSE